MTVIADITVPADAFVLGRVLGDVPDAEVELERVVPLQETVIPLFWVSSGDLQEIEEQLQSHPQTETVTKLTTVDDQTLFEVEWSRDINGLVRALTETRASILEANGNADTWDFRLRFAAHEDLSAFNMSLTENNIPITLRHIYNPSPTEEQPSLSSKQRETLLLAYLNGYFEVPRRTTLSELADAEGVSDSALSQQIRRGINVLIEFTLPADNQPGQ